ncbi:hypothetical protein ACHAXM_006804 [Skeletonema potamos]|jgi:hypothetical protein
MFKWSSANSREYNSDFGTYSSDGSYHSILRNPQSEKNKKRSVTWSEKFQTYEESSTHSFDDYRDDCDTFDDDASLISDADTVDDYSAGDDRKTKSITSSVFTPIELPASFSLENRLQLTSTLSEDDASLIDSMDGNYNYGISKAASDDGSLVSLERIQKRNKQHEIDGNFGHLGLVLPSFGGFFTALGAATTQTGGASEYKSYHSSCSDQSDDDADKTPIGSKRTKTEGSEKSNPVNAEAGKETRSSHKKEDAKKTGKSTAAAELNVAIQQLETKSTESSESSIEITREVSMKSSCSDEVIEALVSDEVSENGKTSENGVKKKEKKHYMFGFKNKHKGGKSNAAINKSLEEGNIQGSQEMEQKFPASNLPNIEVESLVESAMFQEQFKKELAQVKQEDAISKGSEAEKNRPLADKKGKGKRRSLMNKFLSRRKRSTILSGRELEFAFAQLNRAPEDKAGQREEIGKESSENVSSVGGGEQEQLAPQSEKYTAQHVNSTTRNIESEPADIKTQEGVNTHSKVSRKKADTPESKRKKTTPMSTEALSTRTKRKETTPVKTEKMKTDKMNAPDVAKQKNVIVDLPTRSLRDHLYNDILRAGSFDSVSTTEDILIELQLIEDVAQKMYQSMLTKGKNEDF